MNVPASRRGPSSLLRFGVLLVAVAVVLVGLRALLRPHPERRNIEYFPDMATSPAVESQSLSALLPGGISHQAVVLGVVPRGVEPFHYGADADEAKRAGRELHSPLDPTDRAALARGAQIFAVHCVPCHDTEGGGRGLAVLRGMLPPPPLQGANALAMTDGEIFHLLTLGRGNMPALGGRIAPRDRWAAILHVRALQAPPPPPAAPDKEDGK